MSLSKVWHLVVSFKFLSIEASAFFLSFQPQCTCIAQLLSQGPMEEACSFSFNFFIFTLSEAFLFSQFAWLQEMGHGSTQQTVYCAYKWELLWGVWKVFQIWNLTLGLKFPSCYPPGVPLPNTAVTGEAESQQRPSGEAGDLSPSWGPHTEPGVRISPEPTVDSSLSTSEQSSSVTRSFITEGWANWGNGSLQISYLWQDFHDAAGFVIIHSSLLKFSFCSVFFSL